MRHPEGTNAAGCFLVVMVLAWVVSGCTTSAVDPGAPPGAFTAHLDERVPRLMNRYDVPGATLALVRRGEVVWTGAYGYADRERKRPMTVDAVFRGESISKPVTAWGVMTLVEQGRVELDAPLTRYLDGEQFPELDAAHSAVTVRRMLSHSAGLPLGPIGEGAEYAPGGEAPSLRAYLSREVRLAKRPGSGFLYSNVGYNLLELLVEEVTGRDFAAYMREQVLNPLGMRDAGFVWEDSLRFHMPRGYERAGAPVAPYVYSAAGGGGLFATVNDVARFVMAEVCDSAGAAQSVLSPESIRILHTPQVEIAGLYGVVAEAYGLGHFLETLPDGQRAVWHGGQGHGWMTHIHAVPATGDGIVILTNSERSWPLMARVLRDWARWGGFGSVQFGRIVYATAVLWGLIGVVALASLWQAIRLVRGWRRGRRRWAPLARTSRFVRGLQIAAAICLIAALAWSLAQPYLFVMSIFPITAPWAGIMLLIGAVVMTLSAVFPVFPPVGP